MILLILEVVIHVMCCFAIIIPKCKSLWINLFAVVYITTYASSVVTTNYEAYHWLGYYVKAIYIVCSIGYSLVALFKIDGTILRVTNKYPVLNVSVHGTGYVDENGVYRTIKISGIETVNMPTGKPRYKTLKVNWDDSDKFVIYRKSIFGFYYPTSEYFISQEGADKYCNNRMYKAKN